MVRIAQPHRLSNWAKSNVGIIWHINIDPVNFNRKYKALIKNQMAQFTR